MGIIEADHYRQTRTALKREEIVRDMARELIETWEMDQFAFVHEDSGSPRYDMMLRANDEYRKRGGETPAHLGGVAEAIIELLREGL